MFKKILFFILSGFLSILPLKAQVELNWVKSFNGVGNDLGTSITVDRFGNVYTIGYFTGVVDFDPDVSTYNLSADSNWNADIFISKLDSNGSFKWAKSIGGKGTDIGWSSTVDYDGNIYFSGYFKDTVDFDPDTTVFNLISNAGDDVFICKLDFNGDFVWAKSFGGSNNDNGLSITIDTLGNIYTTGYFFGTVDFDPSPSTYNLTSAGSLDVFILKLDVDGNFIWVKSLSGTNYISAYSISIDSKSNIYVAGTFYGTIDFNPDTPTFNLTSAGNNDIFISKLDSNGNFIYANKIGGTNQEIGLAAACDKTGNAYLTGSFVGSFNFTPLNGDSTLTSKGDYDILIAKIDTLGRIVWIKNIGGIYADYGFSIAVDINENIYTTGWFNETADFDPNIGVYNLSSLGGKEIFISKLNTNGSFVWATRIGGLNWDESRAIKLDELGHIYLTGSFQETVDFDPDTTVFNLTSATGDDVFVLKLNQNSITTNNNEFYLSHPFVIYPNPTSTILNFVGNTNEEIRMEIFTIDGKLLENKVIKGNIQLNISDFPKGFYIIKATNNVGKIYLTKFVKQ